MPLITMRVECLPTEDPEKVKQAVLNLFPGSEIEGAEGGFFARCDSTERFKEVLWNLRILDTARAVLLRGMRENRTSFSLNKQVAFVGKVSFVQEPMPLGSIDVVVEDEHLDELIDSIAPRTVNGEAT